MSASLAMPETPQTGLTAQEVASRMDDGRSNRVRTSTSRSLADIVRANVFTLFNGIILAAMVMVLATGSWRDAVFGFVILINTGIGIFTELRAKRTLDRLSILVAANYVVRRDGRNVEVPHDAIVLDDLLWIRSGDQVPADADIVDSYGLELDESMLTGESRTVRKDAGDQVFSGSTAVSGMALARVTAVGEHGYAATLTAQAKVYKKTVSDLNKGINTILKFMTFLVVPLCVLLILSQIHTVGGWSVAISTGEWRQAVVSAVAGVVGMIPEGLVLLTSLNFAIAAMRLARHNTLVQELESVETLARVDCLNLDKTGTVTDGGIAFDRLIPLGGAPAGADERAASQAGYGPGAVESRVPFSSARKWSAVAKAGETWYMGAPEVIVAALDGDYAEVLRQVNEYADDGNRVLLVARSMAPLSRLRRQLPSERGAKESGLAPLAEGSCPRSGLRGASEEAAGADEPQLDPQAEPVALVLCSEKIRDDAESTLAWFREQGVRCRVISGDNPATVGAIAAKVRLTGDGVNDALAIKEADLGIAMGNAAPATKAVAQVVLVDSKFSHLPDVVARGRQVMANMERVASLFLVKTVYSALISLGVVLTAIPFPYLPRHITYIGGLTIGAPAFILALAPNTRRYIPGFLKRVVRFALPGGMGIALSVLIASWALPGIMGWNVERDGDLASLRATCAIIVFVLGVLVLARVAQPLDSWRGILVAGFAAAGVIGMFIPFVANFFALEVPTGRVLAGTGVALLLSAAIFVLCHIIIEAVVRIVSHNNPTRQSGGNVPVS